MNSVIDLLERPKVFARVATATVAAAARALAAGGPYALWEDGVLVLLYPDGHCERMRDNNERRENDDER